jgi:glycosyltransferase involved in cell wall biosynthesis
MGEGGLQAPAGDIDSLAQAMRRVLQSPDLRDTLRHRGLEHARRFSWVSTARQTLDVYAAAGRP